MDYTVKDSTRASDARVSGSMEKDDEQEINKTLTHRRKIMYLAIALLFLMVGGIILSITIAKSSTASNKTAEVRKLSLSS